MVFLENISKKAGDFRIEGLSMELKKGAFNVLLGPTGSGKTLLLEIIAGLVAPSGGKVWINSMDAAHLPPEKRNCSYLPQDHALFPHKNVFRNIAFGLELRRCTETEIQDKVKTMAEALKIGHLLDRKVQRLSGGEQQRVALARALVLDTPLLLLDEPTSALHETMQEDFGLMLKKIHETYKFTALMATHHKDSAFLLADTLHFIDQGSLLLSAPARDVFRIPLPHKVAELLGINNFLLLEKTGAQDGLFVYHCRELDTVFSFSQAFCAGQPAFCLGVKPEDIRVVKAEERGLPQKNAFPAEVEDVLLKENDALVVLKSLKTGFRLSMRLPIYTCRKLGLARKGEILCKIKEGHVSRIV